MNDEHLKFIASAISKDRWREQGFKLLLVIILLASPLIAMVCNLAEYHSWHFTTLWRSLKGGYFMQDPGGFMFQQPSFGVEYKGWSGYLNNAFASLILATVGIYIVFGLIRWGFSWLRTRNYKNDSSIKGFEESVAFRALIAGVYDSNVRNTVVNGRHTSVVLSRDYVIIATQMKLAAPQTLLENARPEAGKLILPISASPKSEAVLEGEFLENFHVYASPKVFHLVAQIFSPSLLDELSQVKIPVYIELAGPALIFVFRKADVNSQLELADRLGVTDKLAASIEGRLAVLPPDELDDSLQYGLTAYRARRLRLGSLTIRGWYFKLVLLLLIILNAYKAVYGTGLTLNDSILQLWLMILILIPLSYAPATRRLKAHRMLTPTPEASAQASESNQEAQS